MRDIKYRLPDRLPVSMEVFGLLRTMMSMEMHQPSTEQFHCLFALLSLRG